MAQLRKPSALLLPVTALNTVKNCRRVLPLACRTWLPPWNNSLSRSCQHRSLLRLPRTKLKPHPERVDTYALITISCTKVADEPHAPLDRFRSSDVFALGVEAPENVLFT
jgi:hypothetical protein